MACKINKNLKKWDGLASHSKLLCPRIRKVTTICFLHGAPWGNLPSGLNGIGSDEVSFRGCWVEGGRVGVMRRRVTSPLQQGKEIAPRMSSKQPGFVKISTVFSKLTWAWTKTKSALRWPFVGARSDCTDVVDPSCFFARSRLMEDRIGQDMHWSNNNKKWHIKYPWRFKPARVSEGISKSERGDKHDQHGITLTLILTQALTLTLTLTLILTLTLTLTLALALRSIRFDTCSPIFRNKQTFWGDIIDRFGKTHQILDPKADACTRTLVTLHVL